MGHLKGFLLGGNQLVVRFHLGADFVVLGAENLVEHQHADVLKQRGKKRLFLLNEIHLGRDGARGGGGIETAPPVFQMIEAGGFIFAQRGNQGEAEHERFDGLEAKDHQGVADGSDVVAAAVKAAVHRAENFAGEGGVLGNDAGNFRNVDVWFAGKVENLHGNGRQCRQIRALLNLF